MDSKAFTMSAASSPVKCFSPFQSAGFPSSARISFAISAAISRGRRVSIVFVSPVWRSRLGTLNMRASLSRRTEA